MSNFSADKLGASFILWSPMEQPNVAPDGTMYWDVITELLYIKQFGTWEPLTTGSAFAPLNSPHFTGIPTAPTAAALNNSTQLATTAYADSAVGVEKSRALAAEALLAALASPNFTGVPTAPTAAPLNNSTQLATTAYTDAAVLAGTGPKVQHLRFNVGTVSNATLSTVQTVNWTTPFADNNYTVVATALIGEATTAAAVTDIICVASVELQAAGAGVLLTVSNADSIVHTVIVNLLAIHD